MMNYELWKEFKKIEVFLEMLSRCLVTLVFGDADELAKRDAYKLRDEKVGRGKRLKQLLRTQLHIAPNFFSKLIQIVNQIWNFMFEGGGKHNSKIEIPSC